MTIGIDPILVRIGGLEIRWYGLIMALAVGVGLLIVAYREAPKRGISSDQVFTAALFAIPGGVLGARLVHVLDNLDFFLENPTRIFGAQLMGLAIYGVLLGGLSAVALYCRYARIPVLRMFDSLALAIPVSQFIGRFANLINGDTWGSPTELPWGIAYIHPDTLLPMELLGVPTHPTPVYEQLWLLLVVALLLLAGKKPRPDGFHILLYLALYSFGRFFISIFRVNDPWLLGLKQAQVIALLVFVLSVAALLALRTRVVRT